MAENPQSHLTFHDVIKQRVKFYEEQAAPGARKRTAISVTLWRRYNNDYFGQFDSQLNQFVSVPDEGLMRYPILGPAVRANNANWLATKIKPEITGASSDPGVTAGVNVADAIASYFSKRDWNENLEELMAEYCQLSYTYLLLSGNAQTQTAEKIKRAKFKKVKVSAEAPTFVCANCGASGSADKLISQATGDNEQGAYNYSTPLTCPVCKEQRAYLEEGTAREARETDVPDGYEEVPGGDNYTKIYSGMCFLIDEVHAKGGNTADAHWIALYNIKRRYELEGQFPHLKDEEEDEKTVRLKPNDGKEWLDSVKWWHALQMGVTDVDAIKQSPKENRDDDLLQEAVWYQQPIMWKGWKSPADYTHKSSGFEIKQGQTMAQAFRNSTEKYPKGRKFVGLYLSIVGDKLAWIDTRSHVDCAAGGLWLMNGSSFHGKPQLELLDFQTAANEWFTMFYQHGLHSSMPHTILDGQMYDKADFPNQAGGFSYTRKGVMRNRPISDYIARLQPASMNNDMFSIWQAVIKEGAQDTAGVSKASVGQSDTANKTFGGQNLLTQRALGLMIPSQKSKKRAYIQWLYQQLIHIQQYASDERILQMMTDTDKSWDASDIQAFRELNIRRDVVIDAPEGSDIPVTFTERQQKLLAVVTSGLLWDPNVPDELKEQIVRYAGIDYDPNNFKRDREYLLRVMKKIEKSCEWADVNGKAFIVADEQMAMRLGVPPGQVVINPLAIQQILTLPGVEVMPRNMNIPLAVQMFNKRITALMSAEEPDTFLVKVLQMRVDALITQQVQNTTDEAVVTGQQQQLAAGDPEGQPTDDGGAEAAMKIEADAVKQDKEHAHEKDMSKQEHDQDMEIERLKLKGAQQKEANDKVPDEMPA